MTGAEGEGPVLVLGATSLVGRFLLPRLVDAGVAVAALSRRPPAGPAPGVAWIEGDVHDPELPGRLPPAAVVFSLAPIWLLPPLLPVLVAGGMQRLVAFSSTSRFTKAASPEASERAVAQRLAEGEAAAIAGRGEGRRQPVHADDLAAGALAAAAAPAARDRAYELPGGETLTYAEMAARVFEGLGRRPRLVHVPPALWRAGFALAAPLLPGATGAMGARMAEDLVFDPEPARRDFGWSPRPFHPDFSGVP
jgi:nucleoside-diphosphate-sugar epimerase